MGLVVAHKCPFYAGKRAGNICIKFSSQHYREKCPFEGDRELCDKEALEE